MSALLHKWWKDRQEGRQGHQPMLGGAHLTNGLAVSHPTTGAMKFPIPASPLPKWDQVVCHFKPHRLWNVLPSPSVPLSCTFPSLHHGSSRKPMSF